MIIEFYLFLRFIMDFAPQASGTWRCVAGSSNRSYAIEQIDRQSTQFSLAIYAAPQIDPQQLIEVVQIQAAENRPEGIVGSGTTRDGQTVQVRIFQTGVDFTVDDPTSGTATGNCSYLDSWQ